MDKRIYPSRPVFSPVQPGQEPLARPDTTSESPDQGLFSRQATASGVGEARIIFIDILFSSRLFGSMEFNGGY
ncbi:hypothetical protein PoB_000157100 [Plakobranchus ocellatus]|uniref:Uncharacterized protein n=1 Tax=Plakobranchus ocellatus TaxID=259542 RepID=A0AAV3X3A6_9GAST|nr:hypothetical protein PoB_000157100 [Plakobranchus ocellatus]